MIHNSVIKVISRLVLDIICYADNTFLIIGGDSKCDCEAKANNALADFNHLLADNGLVLNPVKTELIHFIPRHSSDLRILIDNNLDNSDLEDPDTSDNDKSLNASFLHPLPAMGYLGIMLDSKLNYTAHLDVMITKCHQTLAMLTQLCQRKCYYFTVARCIMVYGAEAQLSGPKNVVGESENEDSTTL